MPRTRVILAALAFLAALLGGSPGTPAFAATTCKTSLFTYDHKTGFFTWFTVYNEMRFCYDGTRAVRIEWRNNRTSTPTPPYTRGSVQTTSTIETFEGTKKRARNLSVHEINCAKLLNGFDVTMRQLGYGSGTVTKYRAPISGRTDC